MAIRAKIHTVLGWADTYLSENRHRYAFETREQFREILKEVTDALSDIQTDEFAQYIIYTCVTAEHKYKPSPLNTSCIVCDQHPDHPSHTE